MYDMTRDYMLITCCYVQAVNNIYHSTLFRCSLLVYVADQGRPVRKSIDYLLKVIWRWQRVFIDPFSSSVIIDAFYWCFLIISCPCLVMKGFSLGLSLWAGGANGGRRYVEMSSLIGWAGARGVPWSEVTIVWCRHEDLVLFSWWQDYMSISH